MEVLLPGFDYIDFVGTPTEQVADPPGMLLLGLDSTNFLGSTGFVGPCDSFELKSRGGSEAERRRLLLSTASGFEFDPSLGAVDCGPLSEAPLHTTAGPNAMAAVRDVKPGDLFLSPRFFGGAPPMRTRPDGRCEIRVATRGGLRPTATISGRDGTYGLDAVRGSLRTASTSTRTAWSSSIPMPRSASTAPASRCSWTTGVMTVLKQAPDLALPRRRPHRHRHYHRARCLHGRALRRSTPGSYGWITIVWSAGNTNGRGVWTTNISSGDVAAG